MGKQKDISADIRALAPAFWESKLLSAKAASLEAEFNIALADARKYEAALQADFERVLARGGYEKSQIASVNFADGRFVVKPVGEQGAKG